VIDGEFSTPPPLHSTSIPVCMYLVEEEPEVRQLDGGVDVGVREDDGGRLAAQLERHVLERARGLALDDAAHLGGARERHLRSEIGGRARRGGGREEASRVAVR
jgi:hypothetical protein